jgi:WD40 repeat protein/serine/threonine protein kinase
VGSLVANSVGRHPLPAIGAAARAAQGDRVFATARRRRKGLAEVLAVNERDIFHAAIELTDPAERLAYLDKVCAGDSSLRRHVDNMLQVYPQLGAFLEVPAVDFGRAARAPARAGRFQLGAELARGGMGVVYRARDESLGRDVAVKVLHQRYQADALVGQRFLDEACITAQLQHPAIPPVFEVGRLDDERPYLAMKLIQGRTLEDILNERPAVDRGSLLPVFQQICQAVGYAHSKHILHRDLKPANVMVGAFGEVQVMDWGLAKLLAPSGAARHEPSAGTEATSGTVIQTARTHDSGTLAGSMLGTPAFMAPEQASGEIDRLDERTDVFGLGAILCVILTGEPPYTGKSGEDIRLMAIRGNLADTHARLDQCGADAKLVDLCRACLSPARATRPPDAGAVAATVAGYLAGVEERARHAELERAAAEARSAEQRKRRRVELALAATLALALLGGIVATAWQAQRATSEADRNRRLLYSADVHLASQAWQSEEGTVAQCKELLLAHVPALGQPDLREFCWRYQWRLLHKDPVVRLPAVPHAAGVAAGDCVVTLDNQGTLHAWRLGEPGKRVERILADGGVRGVTLARNGAVAAIIDRDGSPHVFDVATGKQHVPIRAPSPLVNLKLSADGRLLVGVGHDEHARVWDTSNGKELYDYRMIDPSARELDLSLDGKLLLASATTEGTLVVLYRAGQEKPTVLNEDKGGYNRLQGAIAPDGQLAAVGVAGNYVECYDTNSTTRKAVRELRTRGPVERIAFSPDGSQLAVGERTGLVTLWRLPRPLLVPDERPAAQVLMRTAAGQPVARNLKGHEAAIAALAFTADGRKVIAIAIDKTARCWDLGEQEEARVLKKGRQIDSLNYSPDGRYLVESSIFDGIRVHDLMTKDPPHLLTTRPSRRAVFSPDGRTIAGGPDHRVVLWDAKTGDLLASLAEADPAERDPVNGFSNLGALAFSPDGRWLAAGFGGLYSWPRDVPQKVTVFDIAQRTVHRTLATPTQVSAVAFSADGKLMAAAGHDGTVWLWDTSSWDEIACWRPAGTEYGSILFVSGGQAGDILATGSRSGRIDLWDVRTHALTRQLHGHIALVPFMAVSGDGRTLATASNDRSIKLWDSATGRELRTLNRENGWMMALAFSPDGSTLASGGENGVLRLWEASSREAVAAELELQKGTSRSSR